MSGNCLQPFQTREEERKFLQRRLELRFCGRHFRSRLTTGRVVWMIVGLSDTKTASGGISRYAMPPRGVRRISREAVDLRIRKARVYFANQHSNRRFVPEVARAARAEDAELLHLIRVS